MMYSVSFFIFQIFNNDLFCSLYWVSLWNPRAFLNSYMAFAWCMPQVSPVFNLWGLCMLTSLLLSEIDRVIAAYLLLFASILSWSACAMLTGLLGGKQWNCLRTTCLDTYHTGHSFASGLNWVFFLTFSLRWGYSSLLSWDSYPNLILGTWPHIRDAMVAKLFKILLFSLYLTYGSL
jgi:hypothetical protein